MGAEPSLSDSLSINRTAMAADRTLMAWVRTSTSLISFGFTIYKVFHGLMAPQEGEAFRPHGARRLGLFLILMGTFPLMLALSEHWTLMRGLGKSPAALLKSPTFVLGLVMAAFGTVLCGTIVARVELF
jgi:putative membrane protein